MGVCSICLEDIKEGDEIKDTRKGCGHGFHSRCLDEWTQQSNQCPNCRKELKGV